MFSIATVLPYLGYVIYGVAALLILTGAFRGWRRSAGKQLLYTIGTAAAVVAAIFAAEWLGNFVVGFLNGKTAWDLLEMTKIPTVFAIDPAVKDILTEFGSETGEALVLLVNALVLKPIAFVLAFLIAEIPIRLICALLGLFFGGERCHRDTARFFGTVFGVARGALVALVLAFPILTFCDLYGNTVTYLQDEIPDSTTTENMSATYDSAIRPISENFVVSITRTCGGEILEKRFSTQKSGEEETDLREDAAAAVGIFAQSKSFTKNTDWASLTDAERAALNGIVDGVTGSDVLSTLAAGALRGVSTAADSLILKGDRVKEPFRSFLQSLVGVFSDETKDTVGADLATVEDVYYVLMDAGVLGAMNEDGDVTAALTATDASGKTVISRVIAILDANDRTKAVTAKLTDISFALLLGNTGMDEEAMQTVEKVKDDVVGTLNDVLALNESDYANHDAYVDAVSEKIDGALKANDVTLDPDVLAAVAEYAASGDSFLDADGNRMTEVGDEDLMEFLLSYYDAYASAPQE